MKWFNKDPRPHQTALSMIGAKPGQQVLVLGAGDGQLAAAVATVTGLNGRTEVIDSSAGAAPIVNAAAGEAGALVEFAHGTYAALAAASSVFDIVLLNRVLGVDPNRPGLLAEAVRALRPGGRLIVIEGESVSGWRGLVHKSDPPAISGTAACDLLTSSGLRAPRVLAESEGVTYVEGAKSR